MAKEQIGYGGSEGAVAPGLGRNVIAVTSLTRTLTAAESGALVTLSKVDGVTVTLPTITATTVGMVFDFAVITSATSVGYKVITAAAQFIVGNLSGVTIATASPAGYSADGTATRSVNLSTAEKGWLLGGSFRLTAVSTTQWQCQGISVGSGTITTGFANS